MPTSAGTPKTRRRRRRAGDAVKREIRVHPRARFSIVRPAGLRREAGAGISRWKLICRDEKYRRRHTVSSWKYVALPGIRAANSYTRVDSRWCAHFDLYKSARSRTKGVILIVSRGNIAQKHFGKNKEKNHRVYQRTPVVAALP